MSKKYNRHQKENKVVSVVKYILTGVAIALLFNWINNNGYNGLTMDQIILTVYMVGLTTGIWIRELLD